MIFTNDFLASPQSSERISSHPVYIRSSPQYIQYEDCVAGKPAETGRKIDE
jgi:hypothetical protein